MREMVQVSGFRVDISDDDVADLRDRLSRTRWPDPEPVPDWSQGIPLTYVRELAQYWANDYDMTRLAHRLNQHPQFHAVIGDLGIHFLHVRSPHENARPLILTHGWPGSVIEFLDVIGPLTEPANPEDAFDVVIPSLPGYGFSDKPTAAGVGVERIADAWDELMTALGYSRYYAQGGDWGSGVTTVMAAKRPAGLLGIHLNFAVAPPEALGTLGELTSEEQQAIAGMTHYQKHEAGYSTQQSTRPQTLGYALADSPVGQLAWITEKFHAWTDCDGHPEKAVPRDVILDNVMMYWLTNSATSSARLYWESFGSFTKFDEIALPSAYTRFPKELFTASERWLRTLYTGLRYFGSASRGGHFAALEQPEIFVDEVRSGIKALDVT